MSDVPTSPLALLLFVVLLLPGFVYVLVWERVAPHRRPSAFRETALVVFGSVLAELATLGLFLVFRALVPAATPDIGRLVRLGVAYAIPHWVSLTWWGLGLLGLACVLAGLAGAWAGSRPHPSTQSAWWRVFKDRPEEIRAKHGRFPTTRVCCVLDNGSQIEGTIAWFNQVTGDVPDRDLVLLAPLVQWDESGGRQDLESQVVVLSGRNIKATHLRYELAPASAAGSTAGAAGLTGSTISEPGDCGATGSGQDTGSG